MGLHLFRPLVSFIPSTAEVDPVTKGASVVTNDIVTVEEEEFEKDERTGKRIWLSFLLEDTIARAKKGSPAEKAKLGKDGTSAFVDVYEYAAKIRSGEMTWDEVEKADLDTVSFVNLHENHLFYCSFLFIDVL